MDKGHFVRRYDGMFHRNKPSFAKIGNKIERNGAKTRKIRSVLQSESIALVYAWQMMQWWRTRYPKPGAIVERPVKIHRPISHAGLATRSSELGIKSNNAEVLHVVSVQECADPIPSRPRFYHVWPSKRHRNFDRKDGMRQTNNEKQLHFSLANWRLSVMWPISVDI